MISTNQIGVVFDLDGVLVDSHEQHHEAFKQLGSEIGKELTDAQFVESFGMRNETCIPHVFHWADAEDHELIAELGDRKEVFYREILAQEPLAPLPGVLEFTKMLSEAGIPGSVGSSTSVLNIDMCLKSTGLDSFFGKNFTGAEDVSRGKPAPDVFLEAARKIGKSPENCIVIEDAHVGVEAALAAGMKVIAVTTTHEAETFEGKPNRIVETLADVTLEDLLAL
ncbi:MAG: HAD family phosphatase [Verrucomicrobiales bacterium]|nr:HAD family phosphatase [Verrucomicrobiales bacterium]